jgi:hypothetical protein
VAVAFECPRFGFVKPGQDEFYSRLSVPRLPSLSAGVASAFEVQTQTMHFACDADGGCGYSTMEEIAPGSGREVTSRRTVRAPPATLVVCVRRYWVDRLNVARRDAAPVDVGFELHFCGTRYCLVSFVVHHSPENSARSGHYKSWALGSDGSWAVWDDQVGFKKSPDEARQEARVAYLFFYERSEAS